MKCTHVVAMVVSFAVVAVLTKDARAMYHSGTGRWLQRDSKGYIDGASLYQYVRSSPTVGTDPGGTQAIGVVLNAGPSKCQCQQTVDFKGHGLGWCMTRTLKDKPDYLTAADVTTICDNLCDGATLNLYACNIGNNEKYMRELAAGCPKIRKVCGYTENLKYIETWDITLPLPWNWHCIDIYPGVDILPFDPYT